MSCAVTALLFRAYLPRRFGGKHLRPVSCAFYKKSSLYMFSTHDTMHLNPRDKVLYNPIDAEIESRAERPSNTRYCGERAGGASRCVRTLGRAGRPRTPALRRSRAQTRGWEALLTIAHIVPALYECRVLLREVRGCHVLVGAVERVLGPVAANSARGEHGLDRRTQRRGHLLGMESLPVDTAEEGVRLEQ